MGSFTLAHIGCGQGTKNPMIGCWNGSTCNASWCWAPAAPLHPNSSVSIRRSIADALPSLTTPVSSCDNPHWAGMMHATSPSGPWTEVTPPSAPMVVDGGAMAWHPPFITNPLFWSFENGSVLLAYSTGCPNCTTSKGHKHIGLAFGHTVNGPYIDLTPKEPIFPWASEDPVVWMDTTNNIGHERWHIFAHTDWTGVAEDHQWAHVSAHAVASSPLGPWRVTHTPPYDRTIQWDAHPSTHIETRERPQIIFNEKGDPVALSNGVQPGNHSSPWYPQGYTGDWSYTHVQLLDPRGGEGGSFFV